MDNLLPPDLLRVFSGLGFVTLSDNMLPVLQQARKAACVSDVTVLLEGETGTGKQVLAQAIHRMDEKRRGFPFVIVHCSAVSEALAESELFGHRRGAFSGAVAHRQGLFQAAHQGTLLLDDVSDLPLSLQPKLLDAIQRGVVRAVGADHETHVDVRIMATSNQPLRSLVTQNRFRSDLYHRLNVVRLSLPPLRERRHDLFDLLLTLARRHRNIYKPIETVDAELLELLENQSFYGNVRELDNAVQRMLFTKTTGNALGLADWRAQSAEAEPTESPDPFNEAASVIWKVISQEGVSYTQALRETEKKILLTALSLGGRTRREIAGRLHTSERTLYHKIRAYHLSRASGVTKHCRPSSQT